MATTKGEENDLGEKKGKEIFNSVMMPSRTINYL
jgi:hypothetical protein